MTEDIRTDNAPSLAQMESWRRLWNLLLEQNPMTPQTDSMDAETEDDERLN
jgi:hypothetical protein